MARWATHRAFPRIVEHRPNVSMCRGLIRRRITNAQIPEAEALMAVLQELAYPIYDTIAFECSVRLKEFKG